MPEIIYRLEYKHPIQVSDFCESLGSFAEEYKRINSLREDPSDGEFDLYVTEITKGSIIAKLVEMAPFAITIAENTNTIIDFISSFRTAIGWLNGKIGPKPDFKSEQLENIAKVMKPVASDVGAQLNVFGGIQIQGDVHITINHYEGTVIRQSAQHELQELGRPRFELKEKVVLKWYQARYDTKSKSGDRAVIDAVYPSSVKTVFVNEGVKAKMLSGHENPFLLQYLVDVMVEIVQDQPTKYRILESYGKI